ncbi:group 1 truncated hemoglobin [bacterium]|nr:group 1 truncated hemoglobin [bacterium]
MKKILLALVPVVALTAGVASAKGNAHHADKSHKSETAAEMKLYDRLGGKKAIVAVVDEFVANCAADTRINSFFAATAADKKRLAKFKGNLVNQICEASGGPCKYKGKSMKEAHTGMGVQDEHFNALVEDLVKALDKFKVGEKEKGELLAVLGPMKSDIVTAPAPAAAAESAPMHK